MQTQQQNQPKQPKIQKQNQSKQQTQIPSEQILSSDIMYKDEYVCILRPEIKKGVLIFTSFITDNETNICHEGLKSRKTLQLQAKEVRKHAGKAHDVIFFRAPFFPLRSVNRSSIQKQIQASYGKFQFTPKMAIIRVDPDQTFVFSSQIRTTTAYWDTPALIMRSKKTLRDYYSILDDNHQFIQKAKQTGKLQTHNIAWHLFSSTAHLIPKSSRDDLFRVQQFDPLNQYDISNNSEILVRTDLLTPDHFVYCSD